MQIKFLVFKALIKGTENFYIQEQKPFQSLKKQTNPNLQFARDVKFARDIKFAGDVKFARDNPIAPQTQMNITIQIINPNLIEKYKTLTIKDKKMLLLNILKNILFSSN